MRPEKISEGADRLYRLMRSMWHLGRKRGWQGFRPHQKTLAAKLGRDVRSVRRYLTELEEANLIAIRRGRSGNLYYFLENEAGAARDVIDGTKCPLASGQNVLSPADKMSSRQRTKCPLPSVDELENKNREQQQQGPEAAAADLFSHVENQNAFLALTTRGLSEQLARRYADADPRLAIVVVTFAIERQRDPTRKPIRNPVGFLRALIEFPERHGFQRLPTGDWLPPDDAPKRREKLLTNATDRRVALWRQASPQERAEAARRAEARGFDRHDAGKFQSACRIELEAMLGGESKKVRWPEALGDVLAGLSLPAPEAEGGGHA